EFEARVVGEAKRARPRLAAQLGRRAAGQVERRVRATAAGGVVGIGGAGLLTGQRAVGLRARAGVDRVAVGRVAAVAQVAVGVVGVAVAAQQSAAVGRAVVDLDRGDVAAGVGRGDRAALRVGRALPQLGVGGVPGEGDLVGAGAVLDREQVQIAAVAAAGV